MEGTPVDTGPTGNHYDKYASTNPIERRMMQKFLATFDSMVNPLQPLKVLEVGVGEGEILKRISSRFPLASVQGIDLPADHLQAEWNRRGVNAEFGDATAMRFADGEFDLFQNVTAADVQAHGPGDRQHEVGAGISDREEEHGEKLVVREEGRAGEHRAEHRQCGRRHELAFGDQQRQAAGISVAAEGVGNVDRQRLFDLFQDRRSELFAEHCR